MYIHSDMVQFYLNLDEEVSQVLLELRYILVQMEQSLYKYFYLNAEITT